MEHFLILIFKRRDQNLTNAKVYSTAKFSEDNGSNSVAHIYLVLPLSQALFHLCYVAKSQQPGRERNCQSHTSTDNR